MKRALLLVPMLTMLFSMGCAVRARYYGPDRYRDSRYYDRDHRYYHHDRDDYRGTGGASTIERSLIGLQTRPDDLRVISRHDVPVGVRGVRPVDGLHLAAVTGIGSRLNQFRPADFPVTLR